VAVSAQLSKRALIRLPFYARVRSSIVMPDLFRHLLRRMLIGP
jgi:hypothetical protein